MGGVAQSNLEVFRSIIDRGFSRADLSVADEVCAERLLEHQYLTNTDLPGPAILKSQIEGARRNLRDFKLTLEAWVETEDTVWARCRATGIDPGSGKPVAIDVLDICRFNNGKLVEHWGVPDRFALLHQIGALPPPPK
jgi:ketosteroid isomerase-like protein